MPTELPPIILFFDGVCGLCNHIVDFLIAHDKYRRLRYAPLQGETFQAVARENPQLAGVDSLVVTTRQADGSMRVLIRSQGALFVFKQIGGIWKMLATLAQIVPAPLADLSYRGIANTRYRVFGKHSSCRLPSSEERGLFLP